MKSRVENLKFDEKCLMMIPCPKKQGNNFHALGPSYDM